MSENGRQIEVAFFLKCLSGNLIRTGKVSSNSDGNGGVYDGVKLERLHKKE